MAASIAHELKKNVLALSALDSTFIFQWFSYIYIVRVTINPCFARRALPASRCARYNNKAVNSLCILETTGNRKWWRGRRGTKSHSQESRCPRRTAPLRLRFRRGQWRWGIEFCLCLLNINWYTHVFNSLCGKWTRSYKEKNETKKIFSYTHNVKLMILGISRY